MGGGVFEVKRAVENFLFQWKMPIFDKLFYHSISVTNGINKTRYPGTLMPCSSLGEEDRDRQTDRQKCSIAIDQHSVRWSKKANHVARITHNPPKVCL